MIMHIFSFLPAIYLQCLEKLFNIKDIELFGIGGGVCWRKENPGGKADRSKINSFWSIRKYFFTVDPRWRKKTSARLLVFICKCYWFVHVCRPYNILIYLGKRCKANCTFSAEKYTWFTVWKLLPTLPHQI